MTRRPLLLVALLLPLSAILAGPRDSSAPPPAHAPDKWPRPDTYSLIVDHKVQAHIDTARDLLDRDHDEDAFRLLQQVLESEDEPFVRLPLAESDKQHIRLVPAKMEAERLILLHAKVYEALYGKEATALLGKVNWDKAGIGKFSEIGARYPGTAASVVALTELAERTFDNGDMETAARLFARLVDFPQNHDAAYYFRAAVALRVARDNYDWRNAWFDFVAPARKEFSWDNQRLAPDDAAKLRDRLVEDAQPAPLRDWRVVGGSPSRSRQAAGGAPLLIADWSQTLAPRPPVRDAFQYLELQKQKPALPAFFPLAASVPAKSTNAVICRSWNGIEAIDPDNGKLIWETSLDRGNSADTRNDLLKIAALYRGGPWENLLWENSVLGSMSVDDSCVYLVDDFPLLPPARKDENTGKPAKWLKLDYSKSNQLKCYELHSGELRWAIGTDEDGKHHGPRNLEGGHFLGTPLPSDGRLYVMREKDHEIQLLCLDAGVDPSKADPVVWKQTLCGVETNIAYDALRRMQTAPISASGGVLVCQTHADAVLGVDALNHRILWGTSYPRTRLLDEFDAPKPLADPLGWRATAPILVGHYAIVAPADSDVILCIDLWSGVERWRQRRDEDDLYVAGVIDGSVVIVGRGTVHALKLESGNPLWDLSFEGNPSGVGAAVEKSYYLPVRRTSDSALPEICVIDIDKGKVVQRISSIDGHVLGNLMFFRNKLMSQDSRDIKAFPLLAQKQAEVTRILKNNPKVADALYQRAMIRLTESDAVTAVADLRSAAQNAPNDALSRTIQKRLHEILSDLLSRAFDDHQDLLKQLLDSCDSSDKAVKTQRLQRYYNILAEGRRKQGKLDEALDAVLKLVELADSPDQLTAIGERKVAGTSLAQARIGDILAVANEDDRAKLMKVLDAAWTAAKDSKDTDRMRRFVQSIVPGTEIGARARLHLAQVLSKTADAAEVESLLLEVRAHADEEFAAKATGGLGYLMVKNGFREDALHWLLPGLERPAWDSKENLEGRKTAGKFDVKARFTADPRGERLPLLRHRRLQVELDAGNVLLDIAGRKEPVVLDKIPSAARPPSGDLPCFANGHLLILDCGSTIVAVDTIREKLVWQHYLPDPGRKAEVKVRKNAAGDDGVFQIEYENGWKQRFDHHVLVQAGYVAFLDRNGLTAVDPVSGKVLWSRGDVAPGSMIFGDSDFVLVAELDKNGAANDIRGFEAMDGNEVLFPRPGSTTQFDARVNLIGRNILARTKSAKGEEVLEMYDPVSRTKLWSKTFPAKSILLKTDDPALAGMVDWDGHIKAFTTKDGSPVLSAVLDPSRVGFRESVGAELYLLADRERYYLFINNPINNHGKPNVQAESGLCSLPVNGEVYSYDRKTYKMKWRVEVVDSALLLQDWADLPCFIFTSQYKYAHKGPRGFGGNFTATQIFHKRSGKRVYDDVDNPPLLMREWYGLDVDWEKQQFTLNGETMKVKVKKAEP